MHYAGGSGVPSHLTQQPLGEVRNLAARMALCCTEIGFAIGGVQWTIPPPMSRTAVSSVLVPSSGLVLRSSLQSKPFPGQTTGMAAEQAEDAALSEEQVEAAVGQLETSDAGPAMRATLARVTGRLSVQFAGLGYHVRGVIPT